MVIVASIIKYLAQLLPLLLIWWEYRLKYVDKDGRTTDHKKARTIVLFLGICICTLGIVSTGFDDSSKARKERELAQSNTNLTRELVEIKMAQTNLPGEVSRGVNEILIMATNAKISDAALVVAIREKEQRVQRFVSIKTDRSDFSAFAANYEDRMELARLQIEKEARDAKQSAEEVERTTRVASQIAAQEAERQESYVTEKTSPIFEHAIRTLHLLLTDRARQVEENGKEFSTSYTGLPSVINSPEEQVCQIITGAKFAALWDITVTKSPRTIVIRCLEMDASKTNALIRAQNILRNYKRNLKQMSFAGGVKYLITLTISFEDQTFESVSSSIIVRSRLSERFPAINESQPYTNYIKFVDATLGSFLGAQDVVVKHTTKQ